jgi:2-(1,2-epoxy-1,2-dihydrophenyl)acetyl-CoA isomerase
MVDDLAETLHRTVSELHRMNAVVVAVVQGDRRRRRRTPGRGGDLVLAGASAASRLAYTMIGFSPTVGAVLLTASLPPPRAAPGRCSTPCSPPPPAQCRGTGRRW